MSFVLAVPNWSHPDLPLPELPGVAVHYAQGDADHGRTVTAYSGEAEAVWAATLALADAWLPLVDLRTQSGVHPRRGALDVLPFVGEVDVPARAAEFTGRYGIPVELYERDAGGRSLPDVRRTLTSDTRWGVTTMGRRPFLIALNVELPRAELARARQIAREVRERRGVDPALSGVRAMAFDAPRRGVAQVSFNLTRPDETPCDAVIGFVEERASVIGAELVGVIRPRDLPGAARVPIRDAQVVPC